MRLPSTITVSTNIAEDVANIHGDATQLRQILLNLCINARDAMPGGGKISIRADNMAASPGATCIQGALDPGHYVRFTVSDTGSGIPARIVSKLFDPFFTTKKAGKGTGLGLANVAAIVKTHGGFIDLTSVEGKGTDFYIYLPATAVPASSAEAPAASPIINFEHKGAELLIIEDDEAIRQVLKLILTTAGYRVTLAENGAEGLGLLQADTAKFAMVITDLHMPEMTGSELIRRIRMLQLKVRIIILSGMSEALPDMDGIECLSKPLGTEKLLATVQRVLDAAAGAADIAA